MNQYDLNLILNPNLSAEQVQIEKDYIENTVRSNGAEITNLDQPPTRLRREQGPRGLLPDVHHPGRGQPRADHRRSPASARQRAPHPGGQGPPGVEDQEGLIYVIDINWPSLL